MNTKVPKPPRPRGTLTTRLMAAPSFDIPNNLATGGSTGDDYAKDMSFKVSPEFHRAFKIEAVNRGLSMKELLEACFQAYKDKHG